MNHVFSLVREWTDRITSLWRTSQKEGWGHMQAWVLRAWIMSIASSFQCSDRLLFNFWSLQENIYVNIWLHSKKLKNQYFVYFSLECRGRICYFSSELEGTVHHRRIWTVSHKIERLAWLLLDTCYQCQPASVPDSTLHEMGIVPSLSWSYDHVDLVG